MRPGAQPRPGVSGLPLAALAGGLGLYALLVAATLRATGGVFEYPLDDPYIHLALAEQIARGTYGINPGEVSSPGSSPLYPLLLTPFAGTGLQRYLPAFWNTVGLAVAAWLWGRLLIEAGYSRAGWRAAGYLLAVSGPGAMLMPQVAFLGMEHSLHMAAALAVVLGLVRHLAGARSGGPALVVAGAFFGSAFRFEGLALGLAAGAVLVFTGRRGAGVLAAGGALLPVALFMVVLAALGLDPAPSSVQVKLAETPLGSSYPVLHFVLNVLAGHEPGAKLVTGLTLALVLSWGLAPGLRGTRGAWLVAAVLASALAHLAVGRFGWMNRYEHYVVVILVATFVALIPQALERWGRGASFAALAAVFAAALVVFQPAATSKLPGAARAILTQQGQMARFAQDVLKAPVAVNDIGRVAWRNPDAVLDLWGLASAEARDIRLNRPAPGWAGALVARQGVPVAMIYDTWLAEAVGPGWVRLGQLELSIPADFLGGPDVAFYATAPEHVARLRAALVAWVPTLLPGSRFAWDAGMAP